MSAVWDVTQGNNTTKTRQTSGIQNLIPLRHTRDYKRDAIIPKISHHKFTHIHVFYVHLNGQKQNANRMQKYWTAYFVDMHVFVFVRVHLPIFL